MSLIETVMVISGAIGALLTSLCWSIRRSRCSNIETACFKCTREVMTESELAADKTNNQIYIS
jgi:uncharacterized membrane protein affecting hemolysin expression